MIKTLQSEFENLKRDILELKTAQIRPSTFTASNHSGPISKGRYTRGFYRFRIQYKDVGDTNAPITTFNFGGNWVLRPYDAGNNTQDVEFYADGTVVEYTDTTFAFQSSRPVQSVTQLDFPSPLEEWTQVRNFYPSAMGTTPGLCLQNSREGFLIPYGTYQSAREDLEAQQANGTLHAGTPPDYIAVPIYFANYGFTPYGHVAVWDHGTIYSDGVIYPSIASVAENYVGWGEFCDGARVVQHV